jgi:signal peptidase I
MADEIVPPGPERITTSPSNRAAAAEAIAKLPAVQRPAGPASLAKPNRKAAWLKIEITHLAAALVLGGLIFGGAYLFGYDIRIAAIAGVVTVVFGRSLTRLVLPDHIPDSPTNSASAPAAAPTDTMREIVETIVFVVVLVLLLKSFVAEAFVIPTGSMATTLWGYQKVVDCPECGYRFPVNCSTEADPQDGLQPIPVRGCTCPNCRYPIDFGNQGPSWNSGDRVLVAKFLYDLLERLPDRLDVVVFKYPGLGDDKSRERWPVTGPYGRNHAPMNYIKRLIGLPGEVIAIHGGNLYYIPANSVPEAVRKQFAADAEQDARSGTPQLWRVPFTHKEFNPTAKEFFRDNKESFKIIRKPPETMLAMRRIVYDSDHPARDLPPQRWSTDSWQADGTGFNHSSADDSTSWLHYQHVLRDSGGKPQLITDFMGYNTPRFASMSTHASGVNWVNDLMVECEASIGSSQGSMTLELSRGVDRFQARFDLKDGTCTLMRITKDSEDKDKEEVLASQPTTLTKPGIYHLRFADFDDRLTVWVGDSLPFGEGKEFKPPEKSGPVKENDLERPAGIAVRGAVVNLKHLQVWRDTYYSVGEFSPQDADAGTDAPVNWSNPSDWDKLRDLPYRTIDVQPGHFLCLGDNSPESSDGRTWGLVPERLLLGRALLVYFPFDRAGRIR